MIYAKLFLHNIVQLYNIIQFGEGSIRVKKFRAKKLEKITVKHNKAKSHTQSQILQQPSNSSGYNFTGINYYNYY